jgi:hypothetical protein
MCVLMNRTLTLFNAEDVPASIGLIIDNSSSMRDKREDVANAVLAFANASNPEDEMLVVKFNERVYPGLPPSIPPSHSSLHWMSCKIV